METVGKIKRILDTVTISDSFKKREFVLEWAENPTYVQTSTFQLNQKSVDLIDKFKVGDDVKVHWNLKGKEANTKNGLVAFNTLEAWKIESVKGGSDNSNTSKSTSSEQKPATKPVSKPAPADDDDLPF